MLGKALEAFSLCLAIATCRAQWHSGSVGKVIQHQCSLWRTSVVIKNTSIGTGYARAKQKQRICPETGHWWITLNLNDYFSRIESPTRGLTLQGVAATGIWCPNRVSEHSIGGRTSDIRTTVSPLSYNRIIVVDDDKWLKCIRNCNQYQWRWFAAFSSSWSWLKTSES